MTPDLRDGGLRGRTVERRALQQLLTGVRAGHGQPLVVEGPAGIGKSALLQDLHTAATDFTILHVTGVEADIELAYAGLQQLCAPVLHYRDRLPVPQCDALEKACGLRETSTATDRFLVGLAVLGLIAGAADDRPVLCLVDDVQWLDHASAQTLFFVARRLLAERVGLVFALRVPIEGMAGLPSMAVGALRDDDARALLNSVFPGRLDAAVGERIIAEAVGNPLALLQMTQNLDATKLAGGFHTPDAHPVNDVIEGRYRRILETLPCATRMALLVAAAEPLGDPTLLNRALDHLGLSPRSLVPAEVVGLVVMGTRVQFAHPMVRSTVYRAAALDQRREVHRALAAVTDQRIDPARRAWHCAAGTESPDETIATDLEHAALRARSHGGTAAAAAFLTRAVELTPDPARRAARALEAAETHRELASFEQASRLVAAAELGPLSPLERCRAALVRNRLALAAARSSDKRGLLIAIASQFACTAEQLMPIDTMMAAETYLEALSVGMYVGRHDTGGVTRGIATAALAALPVHGVHHPVECLTRALALRLAAGPAAAMSAMVEAVREVKQAVAHADIGDLTWLWRAFPIVHEALIHETWDDTSWAEIASHAVRAATDGAALALLPTALLSRAGSYLQSGEFDSARTCIAEATDISTATGHAPIKYHKIGLAAWSGAENSATELVSTAIADGERRGEGRLVGLANYLAAVLNNGLGRYQVALGHAREAAQYDDPGFAGGVLIELIESAVRAGDRDSAARTLTRLETGTLASGTDAALGLLARSRALLADGDDARDLYVESIARLARTRLSVHGARANLLYGEWLRRNRQHTLAREPLGSAFTQLSTMGAQAFAERARCELLAAGDKITARPHSSRDGLSPQELQIAQLAGEGLTNQEIAARMFVSAHTVEWHMRKVFSKLQIRSRRELRRKPWL